MKGKLLWVVLVLALFAVLLVPAAPVLADDGRGDRVIFGGTFTVESGERYRGDVVVLGGSVEIEEEGELDGDLFVMGGAVTVAGEVAGDVGVVGGMLDLEDSASLEGDLFVFGGGISRAEGATVTGEVIEGVGFRFDEGYGWPLPPDLRWGPRFEVDHGVNWMLRIFLEIVKTVLTILVLVAIGCLLVLFLPAQMELVGETVLAVPLPSLGSGLLSVVVAVAVGAMLIVTLCLSPIGVLVLLALLVAGLFGWTAVGLVVGQKILDALKVQEAVSLLAMALGVIIISLLAKAPCCIGFLIALGVGSLGLGAVVLTRFGTVSYVPGRSLAVAPTEESVTPEAQE